MDSRTRQLLSRLRPFAILLGLVLLFNVLFRAPDETAAAAEITLDQLETLIAEQEIAQDGGDARVVGADGFDDPA